MHVLKAVLAPLFGAAVFYVLLPAFYRSTIVFDMGRIQAPVTRGFYPAEQQGDLTWAWTEPRAELELRGLDRRVGWRLDTQGVVWRPAEVPQPSVAVSVDGVLVARQPITRDFEPIAVEIPQRPSGPGLQLTIDTDPAFVPSPGDARELGLAFPAITLTPLDGRPSAPWPARVGGLSAVVTMGILFAWLRVPLALGLMLAVIVATAQAWISTRGFAPYLGYPSQMMAVALGFGVGTLVLVRIIEWRRRAALGPMARGAVGVSVAGAYLKLLILLHPSMPIGDGLFHAHRFEWVLDGRLYFTSLAPGDYQFPYPILLYLFSAPFALFAADTLDRVDLLRIVVMAADAVAAGLIYWMLVRTLADTRVALAAVAWYHLMPVTAWIMTWGNLTNAFAQAWFVASLALVAAMPLEGRRAVLWLSLTAAAAMLGHPSTSALLFAAMLGVALMYYWRGGPALAPAARRVAFAAVASVVIAAGAYYGWFLPVYVSELARISSEVAATPAGSAPAVDRLAGLVVPFERFFGWPAILAAVVGLQAWPRMPSRLRLLLLGWGTACVLFIGVGVVTPVELRVHYAAFPAIALLAACGWTHVWQRRLLMRACAALLFGLAVWAGAVPWLRLVA
jgi:hypothetical protein